MSRRWALLTYALDRRPSGIGQYSLHLLSAYRKLALAPLVLQAGGWPAGFDSCGLHHPLAARRGSAARLAYSGPAANWLAGRSPRPVPCPRPDRDPAACLLPCPPPGHPVTCIPFIHPSASTLLDRLIYRCWLPAAVRSVQAVITLSRQSKTDLEDHLEIPGSKLTVIPLAAGAQFRPMSEEEFQPVLKRALASSARIFCMSARLSRARICCVCSRLTNSCLNGPPRWSLVIVGARNLWRSSPLAAEVERLDLGSRVRFTGYLPDADLPAFTAPPTSSAFPVCMRVSACRCWRPWPAVSPC